MPPPYNFPRRPDPPPRRKSRPITLALLGAAALSSCLCCGFPAPRDAADEVGGGGGGDFGDPETPSTDRSTPTTARANTAQGGTGTTGYRRSYVPFWLPLFFGGFGRGPSVGPRPGPSVGPRPGVSNTPGVSRGGFGGTGQSVGGGGSGS